ncbi:Nucleoporin nup85 [Chytridiales sp. JEL 0842]|nr:Nucleoporin nup85 [Chytridiales sp. JEL 0842]
MPIDNTTTQHQVQQALDSERIAEIHLSITRPNTISTLQSQNRSFRSTLRPAQDQLSVFTSAIEPKESLASLPGSQQQGKANKGVIHPQDNQVTNVQIHGVPDSRRTFLNSSFTVFASLQQLWGAYEKTVASLRDNRKRMMGGAGGKKIGGLVGGSSGLGRYGDGMDEDDDDGMGLGNGADDDVVMQDAAGPSALGNKMVRKSHLLRISALYRKELSTHVNYLGDSIAAAAKPNTAHTNDSHSALQELNEEAGLFHSLHSIWHLAEIMILTPHADSDPTSHAVAEDLLAWLNSTCIRPQRDEFDALNQDMVEGVHMGHRPAFWKYVTSCVLRGHFHAASSMLQKGLGTKYKVGPSTVSNMGMTPSRTTRRGASAAASSNVDAELMSSSSNALAALVKLLHSMPRLSAFHSKADFVSRWRKWRSEAAYHFDPSSLQSLVPDPTERSYFRTIFGILAGDEETIIESAEGWAETLIALLVFTNPTATHSEVSMHLEPFQARLEAETFSGDSEISETNLGALEVNRALEACLNSDAEALVRACTRIDFWMVAHLTDLLDKFSQLEEAEGRAPMLLSSVPQNEMNVDTFVSPSKKVTSASSSGPTLRDWYILSYAQTLTPHPPHLRLGLEYVARSGTSATSKSTLETLLMHSVSPSSSSLAFRKAVSMSKSMGLDHVTKSLYALRARQKFEDQRFGEALECYTKSEDAVRGSVVAEKVLEVHLKRWPLGMGASGLTEETLNSKDEEDVGGIAATQTLQELQPRTCQLSKTLTYASKLVHLQTLLLPSQTSPAPQSSSSSPPSGKTQKSQQKEASETLLQLFTHGLAPRSHWVPLLESCVGLLESKELLVDSEGTWELMRVLEELEGSPAAGASVSLVEAGDKRKGVDGGEEAGRKERLEVVRFALVRNLARAMVVGGGAGGNL